MDGAHEAARQLAQARWGLRGVDRAIETLRDRRADLDAARRAELREIAGDPAWDGDDAA